VIRDDGWSEYSIWEHSRATQDLYRLRARREAEEMTCAAQAAELLAPLVTAGDTLLDVGCGSGYFFHSLRTRDIPAEYHGIDATGTLIEIGREELQHFGLPAERLRVMRVEDLAAEVDHIVCMNVLSNVDNFHRPLERMLTAARKSVVLRESAAEVAEYRYVVDEFLDEGVRLKVHVNTYAEEDLIEFMSSYGFRVRRIEDRRTAGEPELVIGYPHHWAFFVAERA
jgi:ubiquinone/menaquinone biosynthesis C-methylase UbiE